MKNQLISIVIPTYERADFLDYCLEVHIPMMKQYNIQICIFDNASKDNTEEIVSKWVEEYPYLSYHKSETNIGPDANFERALKYPDTNYVWLLGDTYQAPKGGISYLLELIKNKKYDAIVFNLANKLKLPTKDHDDSNVLLHDLGALMTCLSCLVFSKELLDRANFSRYYQSSFIQTGIIFEDIADKDFLINWVQTLSVTGFANENLRKANWSHTSEAFEIGCKDWSNFVFSLPPSYDINSKMKCIMDFGKVSGLFTLSSLMKLKLKGILNFKVFLQYKKLFVFTIDYPSLLIFLLVFLPRLVLIFFGIIGIIVLRRDKIKKISLLLKEI
jgi:abequosyltransferase